MGRLLGFFILVIYFLVIAVAITEGPMISIQSALLGFIGFIIITLFISTVAWRIKLIDIPDGGRKHHQGKVPLVGGLVLFISLIYGAFVFGVEPYYYYVIISLTPIIVTGTLDGIKGVTVPITYRIIAQILSSWIVILTTDVYVRDLGDLFGVGVIQLNQLGIPFTIFGVVGLCNAFNMLDGKDGLAGSIAATIFSGLLLVLYFNEIIYNWGIVVILSLLVFLAFNLNLFGKKRKIFLGDHGSTGLGHIIGWSFVFLSQETEIISPVSALYFVIVPVLDAILTFVRRIRSSKSIFRGDTRHFHHLLSNWGFSDFKVLFILSFLSILGVFFGILSNILKIDEYILFYVFLTIFVCLIIAGRAQPKEFSKTDI